MRTVYLFLLLASSFATPAFARQVTIGAYINDIQNLDIKSHSYTVDLYIWFRWRGAQFNPANTFEFMNSYDQWGHTAKTTYTEPEKLPSGEFYQVVRVQGRFSKKFELMNYPFDRQLLVVDIEDNELDSKDLDFVLDNGAVMLNPATVLPGFIIKTPALRLIKMEYPTRFGDTREPEEHLVFPRVRIEVPIVRPVITHLVKLLLPILCVVFCAALMFLFHPIYVDSRVGIGITSLLTIVALQITLNDDLPEVDYLVWIEKFYLSTYLYVIAGMAVVVKTTWMVEGENGNAARAVRIDRICLVFFTLAYFAVVSTLGFLVS